MNNIKCGIQLFTLRDYCKTIEDIDKTLAELASWGVKDIQVSGIGKVDWNELADTVKKYGMKVCVTHTPFERMMKETDAVIDEHINLGCDCIGIGAMPGEYEKTEEGVEKFLADLRPVAEKMRERGEHLAYHNHDFDLKLYGERTILERMIEDFDEDLLWFVPDVAWMQIAGEDPAVYLRKMQNRVKVLHFKDYNTVEEQEHPWAFTELGKGAVDLQACYETAKEMGIPYIMFEQDNNWTVDAMQSCKESFDFMSKLS